MTGSAHAIDHKLDQEREQEERNGQCDEIHSYDCTRNPSH
jgi:hypothetical protein